MGCTANALLARRNSVIGLLGVFAMADVPVVEIDLDPLDRARESATSRFERPLRLSDRRNCGSVPKAFRLTLPRRYSASAHEVVQTRVTHGYHSETALSGSRAEDPTSGTPRSPSSISKEELSTMPSRSWGPRAELPHKEGAPLRGALFVRKLDASMRGASPSELRTHPR